MGDNDPVGQRQFSETMSKTKQEILEAVEKVNGHTQDIRVKVGQIETKLETHETRMNGLDKTMGRQTSWNRGLAAIEALLVAGLAALGISKE